MPDRPHANCYWVHDHLLAGEYPGDRRPEVARRRLGEIVDSGVRTFLDLTAHQDRLKPYQTVLAELGAERGLELRYHRLAIRDRDVPPENRMTEILNIIDENAAAGRPVYVHCWGGVGRTGTVVGCHLVRQGMEPAAALATIAEHWTTVEKRHRHPNSPETPEQRAMIETWMQPSTPPEPEGPQITWYDAADWPAGGRGWADAAPFTRYPDRAKDLLAPHLWELSRHSAGVYLHGWIHDADTLHLRWDLYRDFKGMNHMAATGMSGLDLYVRDDSGAWTYRNTARPSGDSSSYELPIRMAGDREFLLYLPLYNGITALSIGVAEGGTLEPLPPLGEGKGRIAIYGTSITQGGCASRPGMAYPAIIQRRLERDIVNLGFSGSAKCEPEVADLLAELAPEAFVFDFMRNTGGLPDDEFATRVRYLYRTIRDAHPTMPILAICNYDAFADRRPAHGTARLAALIEEFQADDPHVHWFGDDTILGLDGEGTVDGTHPTDLGFMRMADGLTDTFAGLLR